MHQCPNFDELTTIGPNGSGAPRSFALFCGSVNRPSPHVMALCATHLKAPLLIEGYSGPPENRHVQQSNAVARMTTPPNGC